MNDIPYIIQCNKRGQIVIPKEARERLELSEGEFELFSAGKDIFLKKVKQGNR
ncbi:MAG: AbrB/MazE/SpoVT family DNA-binding domain-containing protein [Candidatus Woesearchaeota archaeon]|nr:AbrB/MazE/SpoVT family DNA-binding domain-containing protein [Candidatus Woesearchaeota archaeon]